MANEFILKGRLSTEDSSDIGIKSFAIKKLDSGDSQSIDIDNNSYQKKLRISEYSNTTILFDFSFPSDKILFSIDEPEIRVGTGIQDDAVIKKDFSFFRPSKFATVVSRKIAELDQIEDCGQFVILANRLEELSKLPVAEITKDQASVTGIIDSANILFGKLLHHRCSIEKTRSITNALTVLLSSQEFANISPKERARIGRELAFAVDTTVDGQQDESTKIFEKTSDLLAFVIAKSDEGGTDDDGMAAVIYARANFISKSQDKIAAKNYMTSLIKNGVFNQHPKFYGSLIYDLFLNISGAKTSSEDAEYEYENFLPSEDDFKTISPVEVKEWCSLYSAYTSNQAIGTKWKRDRIRKRMRDEMQFIRDNSICVGA